MYINVGARYNMGKVDIPTKAALKREYKENSLNVMLYETTMGREDISYYPYDMVIGDKYSVTGPNPYTNRKWYATVEKLPNGTITVK